MPRRRFYVPRDSIRDGIAVLPSGQAHHLRDVLRLGTGDVVEIFDGEGNGFIGEVELSGSDVRICRLRSLPSSELPGGILLAPALIKSAKFEWILQKATELGVSEIFPLRTRLSDIQIPESRVSLRLERWDRIVKEAARQCGRFGAPLLHAPLDFPEFVCLEEFSAYTRLLLYEKAEESWQPDPSLLSGKVILCVGPEGGWDKAELETAYRAGFKAFSLNPWTLRAETAALAAVAIIQYQIHQLPK